MKKIVPYIILAMAAAVTSCGNGGTVPDCGSQVEQALSLAGENRAELEKVLARYSVAPDDSLKLRAAEFLIGNMPGHSYYEGEALDNYLEYYPLLYRVRSRGQEPSVAADSIRSEYGFFDIGSLARKYDIQEVDSAYLCRNIEWAFKVWEEQPWGKNVPFDDFCEYVLPYRVGDEALPEWRETYYARYNGILDSLRNSSGPGKEDPLEAARCLSDALLKPGMLYFTSVSPASLPHIGPEAAQWRSGSCRDLSDFFLYVCRSVGIPCAADYFPLRGDDNVEHTWVALWNRDGRMYYQEFSDTVTPVEGSKIWNDAKSKVYRHTFGRNMAITEDMSRVDSTGVADMFREPFFTDVTEKYSPHFMEELRIPSSMLYPGRRPDVMYLCLSARLSWQPVDYAAPDRKGVTFRNLDRGYIMRAASLDGDRMRFWTDPFYVREDGSLHFFAPDGGTEDVTVYSKFPLKFESYLRDRMPGGVFEGSNDPDFRNRDTLYVIDRSPERLCVRVRPDRKGAYRYVRYYGPDGGFCNVSEIAFFDSTGRPLVGKVTGTPGCMGGDGTHEYTNVFDGSTETSFDYREGYGGWAGMDFGAPVTVDSIVYSPRNRVNYVMPGDEYELFYCDKVWKSAGTAIAAADSLVFHDVPSGVLYLLKSHSRGQQERIFSYAEGRQVWDREDLPEYNAAPDTSGLQPALARMSYEEGWNGRYTFIYPGPGWQRPGFDDSSWRYGPAAFGTPDQRNVNVRFQTPDIWVRREITFDPSAIEGRRIVLRYSHDDVFQLYVNGIQVVDKGFEWANDVECELPDSAVRTMSCGSAVIAAHCHNKYGGAMVDFGLYIN